MQAPSSSTQPSVDAPEDLVGDLAALLTYLLKSSGADVFRLLGELELSVTQVKALGTLDRAEQEQSVKALSEQLELSLPATSRAVEGLHARELVERREDPDDRRMKRVRIADDGRRLLGRLTKARLSGTAAFVASLSDGERELLHAGLEPLLERHEISLCRTGHGGGRDAGHRSGTTR